MIYFITSSQEGCMGGSYFHFEGGEGDPDQLFLMSQSRRDSLN